VSTEVWVVRLGLVPYGVAYEAQKALEAARHDGAIPDVLLLLEHPPVFTKGRRTEPGHLPMGEDWYRMQGIEVFGTDRGGQVTYHGPGQAVAYLLLDLRRLGIGVRELVRRIEQAVIEVLASHGVAGERRAGMPGVYVGGAKIAAIGLRVSRGCTYHGVALNVDVDPAPFARIDPCGYPGLASTRLADLGVRDSIDAVQQELADSLRRVVIDA